MLTLVVALLLALAVYALSSVLGLSHPVGLVAAAVVGLAGRPFGGRRSSG